MVRTTELLLRCPDIRTQDDARLAEQALTGSPGIGDFEVDWHTGTVRVLTANQDGGLDVRRVLDGAGFPPEDQE